jgi:hypothetical protein
MPKGEKVETTPLLRSDGPPPTPNPFVVRGKEAVGGTVDNDGADGLPNADEEGVGEKNRGGGEPK